MTYPAGSQRNAPRLLSRLETLEARRMMSAAVEGTISQGLAGEGTVNGEQDLSSFNVTAPLTVSLNATGGYVSGPAKGSVLSIARKVLAKQTGALGVSASVISKAAVTSQYSDGANGLTYVYLRETYNGLPVLNALANAAVDASGRVLVANANFVASPARTISATPALSASTALMSAAEQLGIEGVTAAAMKSKRATHGKLRQTAVSAPALQSTDVSTSLVYVASADGTLELAWHAVIDLPDGSHWYEIAASATSGKLLFANDYVDYADYKVYPLPARSPSETPAIDVVNPADPTASPFGWHDTNGVAGPEFTITRGNNVYAYLDTDNNNAPDGSTVAGYQIDGGATLSFTPTLDPTVTPATETNRQVALTNLFYLNNTIHDITYKYGFNEQAGNFQVNNYGKGGTGNDSVNAEVQDGGGINNANFGTPADGSSPRMQMYLWNKTTPNRDGDLDATVVLHEYTHGISNRLTGGPANASALNALQSGGMGEGWSDFDALMLTQKPTDTSAGSFPVGTYSIGQSNSGGGLRRYPYSTIMSVDPETLGLFNSGSEVHQAGEIWCTVLWDLNWALVGKYGATPNIANGFTSPEASGGSATTLRLVLDGMKLQPANPSFLNARDAILQADVNLTGGANQALIWSTFARRGFGFSAVDNSSSATVVTQAFDTPPVNPVVVFTSLNQTVVVAPTAIDVTFSEAVVPASFSVADDISLFTAPDGSDLRGRITSSSFVNGNRTLHLDLSGPQTMMGTYTLKIGPNVAAADNGALMDQNNNGTPGEPDDAATVTITLASPYIGPDAGGYTAGPAFFESIDLEPGQAGVVNTGLSADDSSVAIPLGSNTFNFYGTAYTGSSSIFASTNGLIRVGGNTTANDAQNGDLTNAPSQAAIAPFWNDLMTNIDANDNLLYRFDDLNADGISDRLIIEWSQVHGYEDPSGSAGTGTFQAILELNTGSRIGTITFNYPDLDFGDPTFDNGAGATVGIKAAGPQGTTLASQRILVSLFNASSPYVGSGKAIRIGADVVPPALTGGTFTLGPAAPTVTLNFSKTLIQPTASSFSLVSATTGATISGGITSVSYASGVATLLLRTDLPRGSYVVRSAAGALSDTAGNRTLIDATFALTNLVGDTDGNGIVDGNDLANLLAGLHGGLTGYTNGDVNYDGHVTQTDYDLLLASLMGL